MNIYVCRSGLGNHYGTLSGPIGAFSPGVKPKKAYKPPGKNVYTNPGKKGTGFGYVKNCVHTSYIVDILT